MQAEFALWPTDDRGLVAHPMGLDGRPDMRRDTLTRCQRCDIPLGSQLCPNPECREPHGQRAGDFCTWCTSNAEERIDDIDGLLLPIIACAVLQCTSAYLG